MYTVRIRIDHLCVYCVCVCVCWSCPVYYRRDNPGSVVHCVRLTVSYWPVCNQVEVQLFRRQITCVQAVRQCSGPRLPVFRLWYHFECVSIVSNPHLLLRFCTEEIFFSKYLFYRIVEFQKIPICPRFGYFPLGLFSESSIFSRNYLFGEILSPQDPCLSIVDCDYPRYSVGPVLAKLIFSSVLVYPRVRAIQLGLLFQDFLLGLFFWLY